jgi:hypothetical protein
VGAPYVDGPYVARGMLVIAPNEPVPYPPSGKLETDDAIGVGSGMPLNDVVGAPKVEGL